MNTLKGWIATTVIVVTLAMSATTTKAGIIITGLSDKAEAPCTETNSTKDANDIGIIITGFGTGIIITGLTGIIIVGAVDGPTNCGIIITG